MPFHTHTHFEGQPRRLVLWGALVSQSFCTWFVQCRYRDKQAWEDNLHLADDGIFIGESLYDVLRAARIFYFNAFLLGSYLHTTEGKRMHVDMEV